MASGGSSSSRGGGEGYSEEHRESLEAASNEALRMREIKEDLSVVLQRLRHGEGGGQEALPDPLAGAELAESAELSPSRLGRARVRLRDEGEVGMGDGGEGAGQAATFYGAVVGGVGARWEVRGHGEVLWWPGWRWLFACVLRAENVFFYMEAGVMRLKRGGARGAVLAFCSCAVLV